MVRIRIVKDRCKKCLNCVNVCNAPRKVYEEVNGEPVISRPEDCLECLQCAMLCPSQAIEFDDVYLSKVVIYNPKFVRLFDKII